MPKRHFTLAQANSLIARIRPRIERMMQLSVHLRSSGGGAPRFADRAESAPVSAPTAVTTPTPPGTPWMANPVVAAWQADNDVDKSRELAACLYETLSEQLQGIEHLGAEVKDLSIGLTVFPSYLDGQTEVLLAWTVGDLEIPHVLSAAGRLSLAQDRRGLPLHRRSRARRPAARVRASALFSRATPGASEMGLQSTRLRRALPDGASGGGARRALRCKPRRGGSPAKSRTACTLSEPRTE